MNKYRVTYSTPICNKTTIPVNAPTEQGAINTITAFETPTTIIKVVCGRESSHKQLCTAHMTETVLGFCPICHEGAEAIEHSGQY